VTIEERIIKLEQKNRRLTLALLLTGVAAGLVMTIGMAATEHVPDQVKAGGFQLVDKNGNLRAVLTLTEDGWPGFLLLDKNGKNRLELTLDDESAGLRLSDDNGKVQAGLSLTKKGPSLQLGSEEMLRMLKDGLMFLGKDSKPRIFLAVGDDGPMFDLCNKDGKSAISMGMRKGLSQTDPELFKAITKGMKKGLSQGPFPEIVVYSPDADTSYTRLDGDGLALVHSNGPHASFHIDEDGPRLWFWATPTSLGSRLMLDVTKKFGPSLTFFDENDKIRQRLDEKGLFKGQ
jgi:hypothetical protein